MNPLVGKTNTHAQRTVQAAGKVHEKARQRSLERSAKRAAQRTAREAHDRE